MEELYAARGVRFRYPVDWELTEQPGDSEVTITVSSGETSYWSLTLLFDRPAPEHVLETAVDAFRDEYADLDVYPVEARVCDCPSLGRDLEFICLELVNSAFLRVFCTDRFTALVLYQGTDHELEETRDVLEGISQSLQCDLGLE